MDCIELSINLEICMSENAGEKTEEKVIVSTTRAPQGQNPAGTDGGIIKVGRRSKGKAPKDKS